MCCVVTVYGTPSGVWDSVLSRVPLKKLRKQNTSHYIWYLMTTTIKSGVGQAPYKSTQISTINGGGMKESKAKILALQKRGSFKNKKQWPRQTPSARKESPPPHTHNNTFRGHHYSTSNCPGASASSSCKPRDSLLNYSRKWHCHLHSRVSAFYYQKGPNSKSPYPYHRL